MPGPCMCGADDCDSCRPLSQMDDDRCYGCGVRLEQPERVLPCDDEEDGWTTDSRGRRWCAECVREADGCDDYGTWGWTREQK